MLESHSLFLIVEDSTSSSTLQLLLLSLEVIVGEERDEGESDRLLQFI
jgi:hypothetical protein